MSKKSFKLWSVLLSIFLIVSMVPTVVFAGSGDAISIVSQPKDITAQVGEEKNMKVVANNVTSYQWQRSADGETWSNIGTSNVNYSGVKTDTMTVKVNKTTAVYSYRCTLKNSAGSKVTEAATVTLLQSLEITKQPANITGMAGEEKNMKITASGATSYQWQRSADEETWSNISTTNANYSGAKTDTLTIKISKTTASYVYRCVVKNSDTTEYSEVAVVEAILPVEIKTQPKNISGTAGEEKTMRVVANNATSYQWQRSADGETWSNISTTNANYSGAKADILTIKVSKTTATYVYRCVVKNDKSSQNTEAASVTLIVPVLTVEIVSDPESISGQNGEEKNMSVVANNATSYQWQRSADEENWSNISTTNVNYSGVKTDTLTVKINKTTASYIYRCVAKNSSGSDVSEIAVVSISEQMEIVEQPESIVGQIGEMQSISVVATGATTYQWQRSSDGETWTSIGTTNTNYSGVKSAALTVKISKTTASYIYRCVVKNSSGDTLTSNIVEVAIITPSAQVTFDAQGGKVVDAGQKYSLYTIEVEVNTRITTRAYAEKDSYSFAGWYLDPECTQKVDLKTYIVTKDVTLYAKWVSTSIVLPFIPV